MPIKVNPAQPTTYTTTATPASPTSEGSIPNCGRYYSVVPGDICYTIALNFSITFDEFRSMNPSIDAECTNLLSGFDYCVATVDGTTSPEPPSPTVTPVPPPTSTAPGTTSQCYEWYTTVSGDDCGKIMSAHRISLSQFRTWNPYIDSSCSNLWADTAYCVSSAQLGASIKTSSSTAVATVAPPGPTNEGASTACAKWHVVQSGDSCDAIASRYGITFAQFRSWNPWVNEGCTNIWPDFAYCVTMP